MHLSRQKKKGCKEIKLLLIFLLLEMEGVYMEATSFIDFLDFDLVIKTKAGMKYCTWSPRVQLESSQTERILATNT